MIKRHRLTRFKRMLIGTAALLGVRCTAWAWFFPVPPYQPPQAQFVQPQGPIYVQPRPRFNVPFSIIQPGQMPTSVYPQPGGGFTVLQPGRSPTQIFPIGPNGYAVMPGR
jgi:hypothetical protein